MANLRSMMKLAKLSPKPMKKDYTDPLPVNEFTERALNVARFAVEDYNQKNNKKLEFEQFLEERGYNVNGRMYFVKVKVKDMDEDAKYKTIKAKVWDTCDMQWGFLCQSSRLLPFYPLDAS
ncbi:hypothetical protein AQUCO_00700495v1 [Aquilegia coerulea]|uniref:Cystatin domain-containing protein n=1 Tax=Aquilegia coerulea TaxID=218851 RepID=A0A2G5EK97_AQUCA|nr:hypothetical protein AQUCO_00700495v1 [Aquilegia coerulea]PIA56175.1 hypothetical protein AQUCO_00700495v1 [Aquilegia coerulea]